MEDTGALADLVAREEPLEAVEEARPQGRDAREPERAYGSSVQLTVSVGPGRPRIVPA